MKISYFYRFLFPTLLPLLSASEVARNLEEQLSEAVATDNLAEVQALLPDLWLSEQTEAVYCESVGYLVRRGDAETLRREAEWGRISRESWVFALDAAVHVGDLGLFREVHGLKADFWEEYEPAVCDVVATGSAAFLGFVLLEFPSARSKELFACVPPAMHRLLDKFGYDLETGLFGRVPEDGPVVHLWDMVVMEDLLSAAVENEDVKEVRVLLGHVPWLSSRANLYAKAFEWIVHVGDRKALDLLLATGFPQFRPGRPHIALCNAAMATAIRQGNLRSIALLAGVEACADSTPNMKAVVHGGDLAVLEAVVRHFGHRPLVLKWALTEAATEAEHPEVLRWLLANVQYKGSLDAKELDWLNGDAIGADLPLHVGLLTGLQRFKWRADAAAEQRRLGLVYEAVARRKWKALAAMMIGDVFPVRPAYQARGLPKMLAGLVEILQQLHHGSAQTPQQVQALAPMAQEEFEAAFEAHKDSPAVQAYLETYLRYFCSPDLPRKACDIDYFAFDQAIGLPVSGWTQPLLLVLAKTMIPLYLWGDVSAEQIYAAATEAIQNHWMGIR